MSTPIIQSAGLQIIVVQNVLLELQVWTDCPYRMYCESQVWSSGIKLFY